MIKALILDLDGTVVSERTGACSAAVAEAFELLRQKGILLIAATGRSPYELQYTGMIEGLPFNAVVSLNGQYCYAGGEDLFVNPFPPEHADELLRKIGSAGIPCAVIQRKGTFINFSTPYVETAQSDVRMPVPELRDLSRFIGQEILMLTVFIPEQDEETFLKSLPPVTATRWNRYAIDLVPAGSGKCHGVGVALNHFGIGWDEVFAFGDGDNDYEMLKRAGRGFAMRNSSALLLEGGFEVTDDVDNDGVLNALHKYGVL